MKLNIKVIFNGKSVILDVNDTDSIEEVSKALSLELNVFEHFCFVFHGAACDSGRSLAALGLVEGSVVYAAKKSDKPLRRKLDNQYLSNVLTHGSQTKKLCTLNGENLMEHNIWQNSELIDIQKDMNEVLIKEPFQFEPLILQPPVEQIIHNPSILNSLYSCNPAINDIIEKTPDQVKFFNDHSQYSWIKKVLADTDEMERISLHYSENFKNIVDAKRYKRMQDILGKTVGLKPESTVIPEYDESSLDVFKNSQYIQNLSDLLAQDSKLSEKLLKSCPYGLNMCDENVADIQSVLPQIMHTFKKAIDKKHNNSSIYQFLRDNPIEVDEKMAERLEEITGQLPDNGFVEEEVTDPTKIYEMLGKINSWVTLTPEDEEDNKVEKDYNEDVELLNEMGFADNITNLKVLAEEYGVVNRAAIKLALP